MRFDEFEKDARKQLAESRNLTEEQLDEILPAIGAIAGGVARAAGSAAIRGGAALAKGAARAAGSAVKGIAKGAAKAAGNAVKGAAKSIAGRGDDEETNDPNATVGTQTKQPMGSTGTQGTSNSPIKQGKTIKLPAGKAGTKPFKITKVQGDDVEVANPTPRPGEPAKFVYKKQDLEQNVK
jgi:hypothetical protein